MNEFDQFLQQHSKQYNKDEKNEKWIDSAVKILNGEFDQVETFSAPIKHEIENFDQVKENKEPILFYIKRKQGKRGSCDATMAYLGEKQFKILKDSTCIIEPTISTPHQIINIRCKLIKQNILAENCENMTLTFLEDCNFKSASIAAGIVIGISTDGIGDQGWFDKDGKSIREYIQK